MLAQFGGVFKTQFSFYILAMSINRVGAEEQRIGNRSARLATSDHLKYLKLAVGQHFNGGLEIARLPQSFGDQTLGNLSTDINFTIKHGANCLDDLRS